MKLLCRVVTSIQSIKPSLVSLYMLMATIAVQMLNDVIIIFTLFPEIPLQSYYSIIIQISSLLLIIAVILLYKKYKLFPQAVGIFMLLIVHFTQIESLALTAQMPTTHERFIFIFALCQLSYVFIINSTLRSMIYSLILQTVLSLYGAFYLKYRITITDEGSLVYIIKKLGITYMITLFASYYVTKLRFKSLKAELVSEKYLNYWKSAMDNDALPILIAKNKALVFWNAAFEKAFSNDAHFNWETMLCTEKTTITQNAKTYFIKKRNISYQGENMTQLTFKENALTNCNDSGHSDQLLFATVIHELRTPLNIIMSILNSITENIESFNVKKEISKACCAASLQECLINDVLDMTKVNHGSLQLNNQPTNLYSCLQSVYELFKYQVSNNVNFCIYLELSSTSLFLIDERRYRQIVLNLLSNSAKFTKNGLIKLQASFSNETLTTCVIDTGVGIPLADHDKIFTRFGMVQSNISLNKNGTGLGLNLCKKLVEKMGGSITFESISNVRTKFSFTIKCIETENKKPTNLKCFTGLSIVLIDDNELNLSILVSYSKKLGITYFSFRDPKEALSHIEKSGDSIQIAFIDLHMPEMDGYQCCVEMARIKSQIKMIAISADDKDAVYMNCLKHGFIDVLEKPLSFVGFEQMILKYMNHG